MSEVEIPRVIFGCYCKECRAWTLSEAGRCYMCTNEDAPCYLEATMPTFGCALGRSDG